MGSGFGFGFRVRVRARARARARVSVRVRVRVRVWVRVRLGSSQPSGRSVESLAFLLDFLPPFLLDFLPDFFLSLPFPLPAGQRGRQRRGRAGAEQMSACGLQRVGRLGTQPGRSQGDINCLTSLPCTARVTTNADADQEQRAARCSGADDNCGLLGAHAGHLVATARCWRGWRGCLEVNGGKYRQL